MNCGSSRGGAAAKKVSVDVVCNTLLFLLYERARQDENNLKLLEECNKIFTNPREKEKDRSGAITRSSKADNLPEFVDAFLAIAAQLNINIIVALDEADCLDAEDQQELATKVEGVLAASKPSTSGTRSMKFLVGCRSVSKFYNQVQNMKSVLRSIDVGDFNDDDMKKQLVDALKDIPGLTPAEQKEAVDAILNKAGPRFAYIGTIAVPFMREPFQRPLSRRLQSLPEGMGSIYSDALRKLGPNYIELLRTALLWSLLAPVPLRLYEIMDVYHGTYSQRGPEVESEARALADSEFPQSSELEIEQLQDARGPFLRLEFEAWSGHHLVQLQDPPQIRDFCLGSDETNSQTLDNEAHVCTRCMLATTATNTLTFSPKEGHLKLALDIMRTFNNPVFQRRVTGDDKTPLWTQPALQDKGSETELAAKKDDSVVSEENTGLQTPPAEESENTSNDGDVSNAQAPSSDAAPAENVDEPKTEQESAQEDPDDSEDDEDRGELNLANVTETIVGPDDINDPEFRTMRYEMEYWGYHIRSAERLWSPEERAESAVWAELFKELDCWVTENADWFKRWQLSDSNLARHEGRLTPLHVASYMALTSWASHLLKNGADIDETPYGVSETPLQVAADNSGNSLAMLQLLLEGGADPNSAREGTTPAGEYLQRSLAWHKS